MSCFPFPTGKVMVGDYELRFECDVLGEQFEDKARIELRETPDVVPEAIADFIKLIKEDEDLVVPWDQEWLQYQYLRPCKFYPTSAYKRLKNFYAFRAKHAKLCGDLLPSNYADVFLEDIFTFIPNRDQNGCRLMLIQAGNWKPSKMSLNDVWKGLMLTCEISLMEPRSQVAGSVILFDLGNLSMEHVWHLTPSFAKSFLEWVQGCIPLRLKAVHIVNQPYIFNMAFAIFKPFIGEKLRNRLHFHGQDRASLLKLVEAKCLPECYGGDMLWDEYPRKEMYDLIVEYDELFAERLRYGYVKENKDTIENKDTTENKETKEKKEKKEKKDKKEKKEKKEKNKSSS